jgi:hypothetical protein
MVITFADEYWQDEDAPGLFNYIEWAYRTVVVPAPYQAP